MVKETGSVFQDGSDGLPTSPQIPDALTTRAVYWQESGDTIRIMIQGLGFNILGYTVCDTVNNAIYRYFF